MGVVKRETWKKGTYIVARDARGHLLASKKQRKPSDLRALADIFKNNNTFNPNISKSKTSGGLTMTKYFRDVKFKEVPGSKTKRSHEQIENPQPALSAREYRENKQFGGERIVQYFVETVTGKRIHRHSEGVALSEYRQNPAFYQNQAWEFFLKAYSEENGGSYDSDEGDKLLDMHASGGNIQIREGVVGYK